MAAFARRLGRPARRAQARSRAAPCSRSSIELGMLVRQKAKYCPGSWTRSGSVDRSCGEQELPCPSSLPSAGGPGARGSNSFGLSRPGGREPRRWRGPGAGARVCRADDRRGQSDEWPRARRRLQGPPRQRLPGTPSAASSSARAESSAGSAKCFVLGTRLSLAAAALCASHWLPKRRTCRWIKTTDKIALSASRT